jgi:hypothetical protein
MEPTDAVGFYIVYAGLIAVAAMLVVFGSHALLGLLTNAVQTLAGRAAAVSDGLPAVAV